MSDCSKHKQKGLDFLKTQFLRNGIIAASLLLAFAVWTLLLGIVDVQAIGPRDSSVGFATLNGAVHTFTGVHFTLYVITDWLGLVPVAVGLAFAVFGLVQWIARRKPAAVDFDILMLGVFYLLMLGAYLLFETVVINYRPTLIDGYLEVSYPSSTTLLVMCVMPTAAMQMRARIKRTVLRRIVVGVIMAFTAFMVIGRLVSGVHWLSDIIGGALLSGGLVMTYRFACGLKRES